MRTITLAAAFALVAGAALAADPIEGVWQTQPDEGAVAVVQIGSNADRFACGAKRSTLAFCATAGRTRADPARPASRVRRCIRSA